MFYNSKRKHGYLNNQSPADYDKAYFMNQENLQVNLVYPKGRYSVFNNCEHLVSKILTGKPSSAQLTSTILAAGLGGLLYSYTRGNKGFAVASLAIIAGGLLGLHQKKALIGRIKGGGAAFSNNFMVIHSLLINLK